MDFEALYHFLFESFAGIGVLVGCGLVISIIACVIIGEAHPQGVQEPREDRRRLVALFDDDDEDEEEQK